MTPQNFLEKSAWAVIPAIVLTVCYWFANLMTADMAAVSYDLEKHSVNGLTSVYLNLTNNEDGIAIDDIQVDNLPQGKLHSSISKGAKDINIKSWKGELLAGENIELLLITDKNLATDQNYINNIFKGRYKVRDKDSGKFIWKDVSISEKGMLSFNKSTAFIFWYLIPLIIIIGLGFIVLYYINRNNSGVNA